MKTAGVVAAAVVLLAGVAAISQETEPAHKAKPSAGHVSIREARPAAAVPAEAAESQAAPIAPAAAATAATTAAKTESASSAPLLPIGTTVRMKMETMVSTITTKAGDTFAGRVTESVVVNGKTLIPVGASVTGRVTRTAEPRRIQGVPVIDMHPDTVTMPNGDRYAMSAAIIDTSDPRKFHVDEEGRVKGEGHDSTDWKEAAIGAGGGAGIGALAVHSMKGAMIGAGVGTTVAFVRWMARRHSETIPAGTELFLELSRPMTLTTPGNTAANGGR